MPHQRPRFLVPHLQKQAALWPVIGVLGARQVGKTTLISSLLGIQNLVSLDDLESREEAQNSPKTFLAKLQSPVVIDEAQKAPHLFDAIKLRVDKKRIPGSYFLTGSSSFSSKIGIRESLTGRIAISHLHPLSLAELHAAPFRPAKKISNPAEKMRFQIDQVAQSLITGGMPIPAFLRDSEQRRSYWTAWLDTTLNRDLVRLFKRGYDPDLAYSLLNRMGKILAEGEIPSFRHFQQSAQKIRTYFSAMEEIFILTKLSCHELGIGKTAWLPFDSGLAGHLMGTTSGEGCVLNLARCFLWNEWSCQADYQGNRLERTYYKSAQGAPVDAILDGIPFRIVASTTALTRQLKWEERALFGAMKKLGSPMGYLVGPVDSVTSAGKKGIGILPWSAWS